MLGGALQKIEEGRRATERMQEQIDRHHDALVTWEDWCRTFGEEPADVALAWLLHQSAVTAPIIGPRTLEQLKDSARALSISLDEEVLAVLDEIWPGPGGPAPEAYAW